MMSWSPCMWVLPAYDQGSKPSNWDLPRDAAAWRTPISIVEFFIYGTSCVKLCGRSPVFCWHSGGKQHFVHATHSSNWVCLTSDFMLFVWIPWITSSFPANLHHLAIRQDISSCEMEESTPPVLSRHRAWRTMQDLERWNDGIGNSIVIFLVDFFGNFCYIENNRILHWKQLKVIKSWSRVCFRISLDVQKMKLWNWKMIAFPWPSKTYMAKGSSDRSSFRYFFLAPDVPWQLLELAMWPRLSNTEKCEAIMPMGKTNWKNITL